MSLLSIPLSGAPELVGRRFRSAIRDRLRRRALRVERIGQRDGIEIVELGIVAERRIDVEHYWHFALLAGREALLGEAEAVDLLEVAAGGSGRHVVGRLPERLAR